MYVVCVYLCLIVWVCGQGGVLQPLCAVCVSNSSPTEMCLISAQVKLRVEVSAGLQVVLEVRGRAGVSLAPGLIKILVFSVRLSGAAVKKRVS